MNKLDEKTLEEEQNQFEMMFGFGDFTSSKNKDHTKDNEESTFKDF